MIDRPDHRKSSRYRDIAAELQKEIRLGSTPVGELLPTETELMARWNQLESWVRTGGNRRLGAGGDGSTALYLHR